MKKKYQCHFIQRKNLSVWIKYNYYIRARKCEVSITIEVEFLQTFWVFRILNKYIKKRSLSTPGSKYDYKQIYIRLISIKISLILPLTLNSFRCCVFLVKIMEKHLLGCKHTTFFYLSLGFTHLLSISL